MRIIEALKDDVLNVHEDQQIVIENLERVTNFIDKLNAKADEAEKEQEAQAGSEKSKV